MANGVVNPWGVTFLADGDMFVGALKLRQSRRLMVDDAGTIVTKEILLDSLCQRVRAIGIQKRTITLFCRRGPLRPDARRN